jgi:ABC-type siderophore export system fused ATPase/permease subunit
MHGQIGLCLQTGNMARFYADLLKLQLLFSKGRIRQAVYILPTRRSARVIGENMAQFERLVDELEIFAEVISVPMLVIGFE